MKIFNTNDPFSIMRQAFKKFVGQPANKEQLQTLLESFLEEGLLPTKYIIIEYNSIKS